MKLPVPRVGARVLLLDAGGRILLIHEHLEEGDAVVDHWLTPGGGVEPGETLAQAAVRETFEETGLSVELAANAPVVHKRRRMWSWRGVTYDQTDHYFLAQIDGDLTITHPGLTGMEQITLIGERWWSVAELRASDATVVPADLADVLDRLTSRRPAPA
ncbi:MAG: NUDIX domain-containing protein [Actinomycetota bacterium]